MVNSDAMVQTRRAKNQEEVQAEIQLKLTNTVFISKDERSYAQQCEGLRGLKDASIYDAAFPKPSFDAQAKAPGATCIPFSGNVHTAPVQRPLLDALPRNMTAEELKAAQRYTMFWRLVGFVAVPLTFFTGCWTTFSWRYFLISCILICVQSCLGIAMTYHRLLTHRSFKVHKPLEYALAWIGSMTLQESPIAWVSHHRIHHLHTDTPLDPHSPYEGLLHAHIGWLFKQDTEAAFLDRSNVPDMTSQWFYRFMEKTWIQQSAARILITACFGLGPLVWYWAFPILVSWNMAWIVNSACHMWGNRPYETGDLSTDCWWVNLFAFGDGWHCTHHAFPFSARHGLEWYQFDPVWYIVWTLEKLGLAWDIKLPTERDLARRRLAPRATSRTATSAATTASITLKKKPGKATRAKTA